MDSLLPVAAYAGGLAITLILACHLTPARWWRRPTLRNLAIAGLGAWGTGALLLGALGGQGAAQAANSATAAAGPTTAAAPTGAAAAADAAAGAAAASSQPFRVHRALNLRQTARTSAERLATISAGTLVAPTGRRDGDWWEIRTEINGRQLTGWASSLWLRRQAE